MKYLVSKALLGFVLFAASTPLARAAPSYCDCIWIQNGCFMLAVIDPNPAGPTAEVYYNCDGDWYLQGEGSYGGCPGVYSCNTYYT